MPPHRCPVRRRLPATAGALGLALLLPLANALAQDRDGSQESGPDAASTGRTTPGGVAASSGPEPGWSATEEDFGRWQRGTRQCELLIPAMAAVDSQPQTSRSERLACRSVRLDQQLAGLLSIRFLPQPRSQSGTAQQLLLAGVLMPGSQPMRCRDSRCTPQWPMRVQLSALASSTVGSLGLPQARVVQGSCQLEQGRMLCTANDHEGRRWQASVRW